MSLSEEERKTIVQLELKKWLIVRVFSYFCTLIMIELKYLIN